MSSDVRSSTLSASGTRPSRRQWRRFSSYELPGGSASVKSRAPVHSGVPIWIVRQALVQPGGRVPCAYCVFVGAQAGRQETPESFERQGPRCTQRVGCPMLQRLAQQPRVARAFAQRRDGRQRLFVGGIWLRQCQAAQRQRLGLVAPLRGEIGHSEPAPVLARRPQGARRLARAAQDKASLLRRGRVACNQAAMGCLVRGDR